MERVGRRPACGHCRRTGRRTGRRLSSRDPGQPGVRLRCCLHVHPEPDA
ncbi:DUF6207 family protein [Streptomyces sporangiiformans]